MKWSKQWEGSEHMIWDGQAGCVWAHIYKDKKTKKFKLSSNLICQPLAGPTINLAKVQAENTILAELRRAILESQPKPKRRRTSSRSWSVMLDDDL